MGTNDYCADCTANYRHGGCDAHAADRVAPTETDRADLNGHRYVPEVTTMLAIEPPRHEAHYTFDEFWMIHVYKCRCCGLETFGISNAKASAEMLAHHGQVAAHPAAVGTFTTDI